MVGRVRGALLIRIVEAVIALDRYTNSLVPGEETIQGILISSTLRRPLNRYSMPLPARPM